VRIKLRDIKFINKKKCQYLSIGLIILLSSLSGYLANSQINAFALQFFSLTNTAQIPHDTIFINGTDPNNDWDEYEFITGAGIMSDPYNIENLIIEIDGDTNGISILNSHKQLQIRNCIITHENDISSDKLMSSIGFYFQNCTNIQIKWCSANQNSYGILLSNTYGIIIEKSDFNNNKIAGIYSNHSTINYFKENDIKQNNNTGFLMEFSSENILSDNNVSENYNYGIHLKKSNDNIIRDNYVQDNGKRNIFTEDSVGTSYSGNIRKEQWIDGFIVELSAVVLVTAYAIYKGKKHEEINKKDKEIKKKKETNKEN
jgi:parallel beta-helix repeat protein